MPNKLCTTPPNLLSYNFLISTSRPVAFYFRVNLFMITPSPNKVTLTLIVHSMTVGSGYRVLDEGDEWRRTV